MFTNAFNENRGNLEKKSVYHSFCYTFLNFGKKSHFAKIAKNLPITAEPKKKFFLYSQPLPLGPKEYLPGWGLSDL